MKKKGKVLSLFCIIAILTSTIFTGCTEKVQINYELLKIHPETGTFSQELKDEIEKAYYVSPADILTEGTGPISWWDSYPRVSSGSASQITKDMADMDTTGSRNDEGRGLFATVTDSVTGVPALDLLHAAGKRGGAYFECQGTSTTFVMALHQLEDGSYELDPNTNSAKVMAWVWGWESNGPAKNPNANKVVWSGVHSFVNNEDWAYPYILSEYPEMKTPTYPDGTPAVGYFEGGDETTPQLAKFYDSACAKDINGNYFHYNEEHSKDEYAAEFYDSSTYKKFQVLYLNLPKDTANPSWIEYAKISVDFWVKNGIDYFWIDNWNGWDCISNSPVNFAFGDWSEYRFKEYLKNHPEIGIKDTDNFSITKYLKEKALEINPNCLPNEVNDAVWCSPEWQNDKVWRAYIAYKSNINSEYNMQLYTAIKEASLKYNGDRDAVAVCGNDFPYMTFGACEGDYLDIISTEYNDNYLAATAFNTTGYLPNHYNGHAFNLLSNFVRSHNAIIWYYPSTYEETTNSGKVHSFGALAFNVVTHSSYSGTKKSNKELYNSIEVLKDTFSDRRVYGGIGVVYSPDSETVDLIPNGFANEFRNPHDMAYSGWCCAFDELNIPYKSIPADRLADQIDDCEMIVLPMCLSADEEIVTLLKDYLAKGNTVVITGSDAGKYDSLDNAFVERKKPLLADFAKNYKGKKGKVIFMEEDPCREYFINYRYADYETQYENYLSDIEAKVNTWYEKGYITKYIELENVEAEASILTTLNYCNTNNTFFVDIVNMQYDNATDVLTPMQEPTTVKVRIPSNLWGKGYTVSLFTNDTCEINELAYGTDFTVDGAYATITVPKFDVYACIIIQ